MSADNSAHISKTILHRQQDIANSAWQLQTLLFPELDHKYSGSMKDTCLEDIRYHLQYLYEALQAYDKSLFTHYIHWVNDVLSSRNIPTRELMDSLGCIKNVLKQFLSDEEAGLAGIYLEEAVSILKQQVKKENPNFLQNSAMHHECKHYLHLLLNQERHAAYQYVHALLQQKHSLQDIYLHIFQAAQYEIGRQWQENKISVAQEHYCTAVTQQIMSSLLPHIFTTPKKSMRMLACCTSGELHELGLRMVTDFFELDGWDTCFLGANTPQQAVTDMLHQQRFDIIAISTTMTFHIDKTRSAIKRIREQQHAENTKIIVGGNPFNIASGLWKNVGADAYAGNAQEAVAVANLICTSSVTA
jgi:methanogenic corrinoid protein MtbC1